MTFSNRASGASGEKHLAGGCHYGVDATTD